MAGVKRKQLLMAVVAVLVLAAGLIAYVASLMSGSRGTGSNVQLVEVAQGATPRKIGATLAAKGIVGSAQGFRLYVRLHGGATKIKAGIYQLNDGMPMAEILRKMVAGEIYAQRFAVPEGYSIYQLAELLDGRGIFGRDEFLRQCTDRTFLKSLGIAGTSVEGYLHPSTYEITPKVTVRDLVAMMVAQYRKHYAQQFADRVKRSGMGERQLLTLASIVEKEAVVASERPLIASVFLNRLKKRMPLQSDPTAVYGVRAFSGKVRKADIMRDSVYNTYRIAGLPPGPIGNPSDSAIEAVLNPAATNYLYFVARKDGTHQFSATLEEHNRAVRRYLKS